MVIELLLLFLAGFFGVVFIFQKGNWIQENFKLAIAFAGGFLLSISLLHILPDLFSSSLGSFQAGLLVLGGFFLQQFLEYITDGAEHGHFHKHQNNHEHRLSFGLFILLGLSIHSFLEGTILSLSENDQLSTSGRSLLAGIILHKIPASLALSSVLVCITPKKSSSILFLSLFALASPAGLIIGEIMNSTYTGTKILLNLMAIVCGNFLHISTTIVFEGSPGHSFNFQRLLWSLMGAGVAIVAELLN